MTSVNSSGKIAYMYDQETDTWYMISGAVNTNASYTWTATQVYNNTVSANDVINAKAGVNNFLRPIERDAVITSPARGTVCFIRNNNDGTPLNEIQFYDGVTWRNHNDSTTLVTKIANHTIELSDAGRTISVDSAASVTITIPLNSSASFAVGSRLDIVRVNTGDVLISPAVGVTLNSKNNNRRIAARYSGATLIKLDTNSWILIGDLTA